MRPIKFRAKALADYETSVDLIEKGNWVYGDYYFCRALMASIIVTTMREESGGVGSGLLEVHVEVDTKTLDQFTGLLDKNKTDIYFNDIVKFKFKDGSASYFGTARIVETMTFGVGIHYDIVSEESPDCFAVTEGGMIEDIWEDKDLWELELIGNVYDNPELLTLS